MRPSGPGDKSCVPFGGCPIGANGKHVLIVVSFPIVSKWAALRQGTAFARFWSRSSARLATGKVRAAADRPVPCAQVRREVQTVDFAQCEVRREQFILVSTTQRLAQRTIRTCTCASVRRCFSAALLQCSGFGRAADARKKPVEKSKWSSFRLMMIDFGPADCVKCHSPARLRLPDSQTHTEALTHTDMLGCGWPSDESS